MAGIYRIYTVKGGTKIVFVSTGNNDGKLVLLDPRDFEMKFEEETTQSIPGCKVLLAPMMSIETIESHLTIKLKKGERFPDIWTSGDAAMVSENAKKIIEMSDDMEHQFWSVKILNKKGEVLNDIPYYRLNVRRFITLDEVEGDPVETGYFPRPREKPMLVACRSNPILKDFLQKLPIWRIYGDREVIYMNEDLLSSLRKENITGLKNYTGANGQPGQGVVQCE